MTLTATEDLHRAARARVLTGKCTFILLSDFPQHLAVSQRFVWSNVGKWAFWKCYSGTNLLEKNVQGEEQNSHLSEIVIFSEMLPGQDNGEEKGIFLSMKRGTSCGRTKKWVQLCHRDDQMLHEHHARKIIRTEQSTELKPHNYCGTGLPKCYHITVFFGKIHSASQVTWTSRVLRCHLWRALPGLSTFSSKFPGIADAWICSVSWVSGQKKRKLTGNLFFLRLLENQYSLLAHSLFINWQKGKITNLLMKNFWPDFVEGHEEEDVDKVCERPQHVGLGCYSACGKK